tara:strand:+ start:1750 stop:1953 length:204 start_codon:yes stop_codon:yes gene_type:complete
MTKEQNTLDSIIKESKQWAVQNGYSKQIVIDNRVFLHIAERLNSYKSKERKFWENVMDLFKKERDEN